MEFYDVVVLGGGPGGYSAAIRASQLGKRTALIEKEKIGGTCLHMGCIPSKALLRSAEMFESIRRADQFGIRAHDVTLDFGAVTARKDGIVSHLFQGLQFLMRKHRIDVIEGTGTIEQPASGGLSAAAPAGAGVVRVAGRAGEQFVRYGDLIVATGSRPRRLPGLPVHERIMTSDDALRMTQLPSSILIVGGGAIGVEWASLLSDFGVDVTLAEGADRLLPLEDADVSRELQRLFVKRKIKVLTSAQVDTASVVAGNGGVSARVAHKGGDIEATAERMLVSVGREANVAGFGLERTAARIERGVVAVNEWMQTDEPHVYAIGDVIGGFQLAHSAIHEGIVAAQHLSGQRTTAYRPELTPRCVYGRPEVAGVGLTEQAATERGYAVRTGKVSFRAIGKAFVYGDADGFAKVVVDDRSGVVLGVHVIGPHATELIGEATLAQTLQATSLQITGMMHAHPTLAEIIGDAALEADLKLLGRG